MSRVAKRYAKAVFALAQEESILEKIAADIDQIGKLDVQSAEFRFLLTNPLVNEKDKLIALEEIFSNKVQPVTISFLKLLSEKKRLSFLPEIAEEYRNMMLHHNNQVEGELISAVSLTAEQVGAIKSHIESITGKMVLLTQNIDQKVLGGFIVKVEDWVLDNSIRYQLSKLREKLIARS